jgi:ABC-type nitrate/sulfonate/bicarbonate transport system permease component
VCHWEFSPARIACSRRDRALSLFARNIPVAVLIPLTILWFGIDETQKTCSSSSRRRHSCSLTPRRDRCPTSYVETAQTLGASSRQIVTKVSSRSAAEHLLQPAQFVRLGVRLHHARWVVNAGMGSA